MFEIIGKIFCVAGGVGLLLATLYLIFALIFSCWIYLRQNFLSILFAESLILKYKKYQKEIDEYLERRCD